MEVGIDEVDMQSVPEHVVCPQLPRTLSIRRLPTTPESAVVMANCLPPDGAELFVLTKEQADLEH
jgi:hypothetical protein